MYTRWFVDRKIIIVYDNIIYIILSRNETKFFKIKSDFHYFLNFLIYDVFT